LYALAFDKTAKGKGSTANVGVNDIEMMCVLIDVRKDQLLVQCGLFNMGVEP